MSRFECYHSKHRSIIESNCETLQNNFTFEYHKAGSVVGKLRYFFYKKRQGHYYFSGGFTLELFQGKKLYLYLSLPFPMLKESQHFLFKLS